MKKLLYSVAFLLAIGVFLTMEAQFSPSAQKLRIAEAYISQLYVDTVNEERLVEDAIRGMLENLDPHSSYSNAEETRELNEPLEGNFSGIGISFNMASDTLYVIQTISGGPSERVGILPGDRIIAVNDTNIAGIKIKNSQIMKKLRGPKGTDVNVTVLRRNNANFDTVNFTITRADIPIYSVDAAYMVDPRTGYIRVNKFAADTYDELVTAVSDLKRQGMKQLILDLTSNGGGYLNAAVNILGELLEPGLLTVYTEGRNSPRHDFNSIPGDRETPLFANGRLVVMVDQYSASASEITSGAIQDWDRGLIVGRRTYGKGLVQRPLPFNDGSMIRLTIAHYYTPSGRDIQRPYQPGDKKSYNHDIIDRLNNGELMHADSIKYSDSLKVNTLRLNRPIYGGGGISPDVFVPLDTTDYTNYYRDVMAKGSIVKFAINFVDRHRDAIKRQYPTDNDFVENFHVSDEMLKQLQKQAEAEGVTLNAEQAAQSKNLFVTLLKALIGRDIYENQTYFKVYNHFDPIYREAYRLINSAEYDRLLK